MKYKISFRLSFIAVRKYWLLLFFLPIGACDLDSRLITKDGVLTKDTISKAQKLTDSIQRIVSRAQTESWHLYNKRTLERLINAHEDGRKFIKMFANDQPTLRTEFVRNILYNPKFETMRSFTRKELLYGLELYEEQINMNEKTLFQYFENQAHYYSEYGYAPIVGWYYRAKSGGSSIEANILGYLIQNIKRDANTISTLYENYKNIIFQQLKPNIYHRIASATVKELLEEYDYWQKNDYEKAFNKYKLVEKEFGYTYSLKLGKVLTREELFRLSYKTHGSMNYHDSFWYRRYTEGNMDVVYKILREVDQYYDQFPRPKDAQ